MNACNGLQQPTIYKAVEIKRLEPVVIEVAEADGTICFHLILFELICNINCTHKEILIDGEVQETVYEKTYRQASF